ncbi:hypothetical protein [Sinisalibacter aestuarii]|uniref:DUF4377 domain-containing protein n=1 Tax=Sinisalibacter aestuarii TaxID=2949426 RepID=A0ABQ5LQB0_9RHOB|nr:hypothetical protein [Sinisalibacter aestuarii]GKY87194.1 hypothetical protein STA1M1_10630 [Sinisalibacter aestuarii]
MKRIHLLWLLATLSGIGACATAEETICLEFTDENTQIRLWELVSPIATSSGYRRVFKRAVAPEEYDDVHYFECQGGQEYLIRLVHRFGPNGQEWNTSVVQYTVDKNAWEVIDIYVSH